MNLVQNMNVQGKVVLVRFDYNVSIKDGVILDDRKIASSLETLNYLIKNNARVVILSHLGKVKSESDKEKNSLEIVCNRLKELLKHEVYFSQDNFSSSVISRVRSMQDGDVLMLQNTRYLDVPSKLESNCDAQVSAYFANLCDIYINDAFASSHRKHASTYGVANMALKMGKEVGIGFNMQHELEALDRLVVNPVHPFVVIMGGAKMDDKMDLMASLLPKCDYLLCGGGIANTCLRALNFSIGDSIHSEDTEVLKKVQEMLLKYKSKIMLPVDVIVGSTYEKSYVQLKKVTDVSADDKIYDIGPKTLERYKNVIASSKTVFLNGTVGYYEDYRFANGTKELLGYLANSNSVVVVGGGDASSSVHNLGFDGKYTYVSNGGGATLDYISKGKLVALEPMMGGEKIETLDL